MKITDHYTILHVIKGMLSQSKDNDIAETASSTKSRIFEDSSHNILSLQYPVGGVNDNKLYLYISVEFNKDNNIALRLLFNEDPSDISPEYGKAFDVAHFLKNCNYLLKNCFIYVNPIDDASRICVWKGCFDDIVETVNGIVSFIYEINIAMRYYVPKDPIDWEDIDRMIIGSEVLLVDNNQNAVRNHNDNMKPIYGKYLGNNKLEVMGVVGNPDIMAMLFIKAFGNDNEYVNGNANWIYEDRRICDCPRKNKK